jgi:hypothetical protein
MDEIVCVVAVTPTRSLAVAVSVGILILEVAIAILVDEVDIPLLTKLRGTGVNGGVEIVTIQAPELLAVVGVAVGVGVRAVGQVIAIQIVEGFDYIIVAVLIYGVTQLRRSEEDRVIVVVAVVVDIDVPRRTRAGIRR